MIKGSDLDLNMDHKGHLPKYLGTFHAAISEKLKVEMQDTDPNAHQGPA